MPSTMFNITTSYELITTILTTLASKQYNHKTTRTMSQQTTYNKAHSTTLDT